MANTKIREKKITKNKTPIEGVPSVMPVLSGDILPAEDNPRPNPSNHPIAKALEVFLKSIDDYRELVNIAIPAIAQMQSKRIDEAIKDLEKFSNKKLDNGLTEFTAQGVHAGKDLLESARKVRQLNESKIVPSLAKSLFVGIFSEYDSFIGALLKAVYRSKPELFKGIRREISLTDLLAYGDLSAVKIDMLEKEIDSFRRESYIDQFAELEKKFEIRTLREFQDWPTFVEMSQRRNLMTHTGGIVSEQYLQVCTREGYKFKKMPALGEQLILEPAYMSKTLLVVAKVGFMLTHTLWRKILPENSDIANEVMNDAIYHLLLGRRWKTASEFAGFGLTEVMCRETKDIDRRVRVINYAIALKNLKQNDAVNQLLDGEDWSACIREFSLAKAVLKGEFHDAARVMRDIGKKGEMLSQMDYHIWPLFEDFRGSAEFLEAYEFIYGVPFLQKVSEEVAKDEAIVDMGATIAKANAKSDKKAANVKKMKKVKLKGLKRKSK